MALAHRTRRRLYLCTVAILAGGAIGTWYSLTVGGQPKFGFTIGCFIFGGLIGFEVLFVQQPAGAWLRRLPLLPFITISTLLWVAIIAASLLFVPLLLGVKEAYGEEYQASTFEQDMVFSLTKRAYLFFASNKSRRAPCLDRSIFSLSMDLK